MCIRDRTYDPDPLDEIHYQLVYATDWEDSSTYVFSELIQDGFVEGDSLEIFSGDTRLSVPAAD